MGKCALCGKERELTFEHIPPRAAFNKKRVKAVNGMHFMTRDGLPWEIEGLPYSNLQKGMGWYTLCRECNNNTGAWYAVEYVTFAMVAATALQRRKAQEINGFECRKFHPLRFIKQVLSMFCSLNINDSALDDIRELVVNKTQKGIDKSKIKVCMYFTESNLGKFAGRTVLANLNTGITVLSEIAVAPLGFVLYYEPSETGTFFGMDITNFCNYGYDDCVPVKFPLLVYEVNSWLPGDTRTKEEIELQLRNAKS